MSAAELATLQEALDDLFAREARRGADAGALWSALEDAGLTLAAVPEELGGAGGDLALAAAVVRSGAAHAAPVALAETGLVAGWLLAEAGLAVPPGELAATTAPLSLRAARSGWSLGGTAPRVPWARRASHVVVLAGGHVALVPRDAVSVAEGENLAGEYRDDVRFASVELGPDAVRPAPAGLDAAQVRVRAALARSVALAGALERVLELTVAYAQEREQFGRPIGRFQAIQHDIAHMAAETALARAAVDGAIERPDLFHVAAAKVTTGRAASVAATIAHQVHGAIGFTDEHRLHHHTRRLWAWRDEDGSEAAWAAALGEAVASAGGPGLWPLLTGEA